LFARRQRMGRQWISEPARVHPPYTEPPKRKRNILRALLILLAVAIVSGAITSFSFLYYEQVAASPQDQTVIIQGGDQFVPYPETRRQVAERFGGKPEDWSPDLFGGWVYKSDNPIQVPYGRNVTLYSTHFTLYWD
jgi:hypothetical protein